MKIKLKPIQEQVVVVFGASSGIGRETALRFAQKGAKVVVAARGEEGLESLVEEIARAGGSAMAIAADASDASQVKDVADLTVAQFGRLDTWVQVAAVSVYAPLERTTPEEFAQVIDVNLNGQAYGAMAALPYLRKNGGALIHISSVEAKRPLPLHSAYSASKHGVHAMVETLRMELEHDKVPVSVTEILPASINTPFFNHARSKIGVKPQGPPPIYEPGVVADAILYAAAHPAREIIVGGAGKAMVLSQRVAPRVTDAIFTRVGFKAQETQEPRSASSPDDLYAPTTRDYRAEGDFSEKAKSRSVYTWFHTHRLARLLTRLALLGATVGGSLLLARRLRGSGESWASGAGAGAGTMMEVTTTEVITPVEVVVIEADADGNVTDSMNAGMETGASAADSRAEQEPVPTVVPVESIGEDSNSEDSVADAVVDDPNATQKVYIDRPTPESVR